MSEASANAAGMETRQCLVRVWMAISAVWITFWLLIATTAVAAAEMQRSFADDLPTFAFILLAPPLGLLLLGIIGRSLFEASFRLLPLVRPLQNSHLPSQPAGLAAGSQDPDGA